MPSSRLFEPLQIGPVQLSHRVVLAPLTRGRATQQHVQSDIAIDYYQKRATHAGSLLISEATQIAPEAGGYGNAPGIYTEEQIAAWRRVTDAVHAQGSHIVSQLWAMGRAADPAVLHEDGASFDVVSASATPISASSATPRALSVDEIHHFADLYAQAAINARRAGFDLVEIHGANGYLVDQFLQSNSNKRPADDPYTGETVEGRIAFALEVVEKVAKAVGADRTALRLSPYSRFQGMRMASEKEIKTTFRSLIERLPKLAYLHIVESRVDGSVDNVDSKSSSIDDLVELAAAKGIPSILAGGYDRTHALERTATHDVAIAFGRSYISNPDLVDRLERDLPLKPYNRATFYQPVGPEGREGYLDL